MSISTDRLSYRELTFGDTRCARAPIQRRPQKGVFISLARHGGLSLGAGPQVLQQAELQQKRKRGGSLNAKSR